MIVRTSCDPLRTKGDGNEVTLQNACSTVRCPSPRRRGRTNRGLERGEGSLVSWNTAYTVSGEIDAVRVKGCPSVNT